MISKINILAILGLLVIFLMACAAPDINQIQDKWGPPAEIKTLDGNTLYRYYFYKGSSFARYPGDKGGFAWQQTTVGIVVVEFTVDKVGKVIKKRKYWKQPEIK